MRIQKKSYLTSFLALILLSINPLGCNIYGLNPAPSDIYIGAGYFSGEYYNFYTDLNANNPINISDFVFYKGNTYNFHKISGSVHPFYLSDTPNSSNSYHLGTLSLTVSSDYTVGQYDGITSSESFSITIPSDYNKSLHYYCTRVFHTTMVSSLNVSDPPNYIDNNSLSFTPI